MTYVIALPCIKTKDAACVAVCPCDCIHPTKEEGGFEEAAQLFIDATHCVDCGLCQDECPVKAIFPDEDVPDEWKGFIQKNADYYAGKKGG